MKNPFPRGSTEPVRTPEEANRFTTETNPRAPRTQADFDHLAGLSDNNKPTLRDCEPNTADGRVSRYAECVPTARRSGDVGTDVNFPEAMCTDVDPYGDTGKGVHTQGDMPRVTGPDPDLPVAD